ncbi:MAG: ATP-binding cassette domain-containing protein [Candidatus Avigastranaerophilus sp.]
MPDNKLSVILGLNGAGKSTIIKIITGNIKTEIHTKNTFKKVFYLPQNPYYPKCITSFDYLSSVFFKNNWKWFLSKEEKQKIIDVLEKIGLSDKKNINIENLSGGEIQKINIALGLLSGADLFLLDEPSSNMDLINHIKILKMLKSLTSQNITSVIIMHDLNLALKYGDMFIGITKDKKIVQCGVKEFFSRENLKRIFDIDFKILEDGNNIYVQNID